MAVTAISSSHAPLLSVVRIVTLTNLVPFSSMSTKAMVLLQPGKWVDERSESITTWTSPCLTCRSWQNLPGTSRAPFVQCTALHSLTSLDICLPCRVRSSDWFWDSSEYRTLRYRAGQGCCVSANPGFSGCADLVA